jgi:hypothetical protein
MPRAATRVSPTRSFARRLRRAPPVNWSDFPKEFADDSASNVDPEMQTDEVNMSNVASAKTRVLKENYDARRILRHNVVRVSNRFTVQRRVATRLREAIFEAAKQPRHPRTRLVEMSRLARTSRRVRRRSECHIPQRRLSHIDGENQISHINGSGLSGHQGSFCKWVN